MPHWELCNNLSYEQNLEISLSGGCLVVCTTEISALYYIWETAQMFNTTYNYRHDNLAIFGLAISAPSPWQGALFFLAKVPLWF